MCAMANLSPITIMEPLLCAKKHVLDEKNTSVREAQAHYQHPPQPKSKHRSSSMTTGGVGAMRTFLEDLMAELGFEG